MKFFENKTLYTFVAALVSLSLVVYSWGFYSVSAAEVSTLPADIDCTMDYDSNYVRFTVDGRTTSINRHMNVYDYEHIPYHFDSYDDFKASADSVGLDNFFAYLPTVNGGSVGFAVKNSSGTWTYTLASSLPFSIEENRSGSLSPTSYWYSPSQDKIYIFTGGVYNSYSRAVKSYSSGNFLFSTGNSHCDLYVTCIDCKTDSVVNELDKLSGCDFYSYGYSWTERSGYPDDLLCFFANYEISGFYEPDTSKVNTPDYYFNYQYIFYLDGKGYTFIDSAQPLTEVTAQGSYAYLTFADACNKYIYTSIDGITWDIKTTVNTMYGVNYLRLDYSWLYKDSVVGYVNHYDAELVYTNDEEFGVIKFDWKDIHSAISDITLISTEGQNITDIIHNQGTDSSGSNGLNSRNYFNAFDLFLTSGKFEKNFASTAYDPYMYIISGLRSIYDLFSGEYRTVYYWDDDRKGVRSYNFVSMYGLMLNTYYETYNIRTFLETLGNDFMSSVSTLNGNLSGLYDLDSKLLSAVKDIKIPDYNNVLTDISAKLDKLPASGSSAFVPFDDAAILERFDTANDYLKDIKGLGTSSLLMNILNLLTGTDGEGMKVTINPNFKLNIDNDLKASFSAKIDKLFDEIFKINASLDKIAEFNFGTGGTDKDYSSVLTLINDNLYTASGRIYDLNQPLEDILQAINNIDLTVSFPESEPKNDLFYDNLDSDEDLIDFVSEYAKTALDKSYFASYLTFDNDTMSAIRFYNGLSEDIFEALGPLGAALLVSVGFTLVGAAVRRHT